MRATIGVKLLLVFGLTAFAIVVAMALALQWSIGRGFGDYLASTELQRMEPLVGVLEDAYADRGGWEFLRDNPRAFRRLQRKMRAGREDAGRGLGPPPDRAQRRPPRDGRGPPPRRGEGPGPPPHDPLGLGPRLMLLDASKRSVVGPPLPSQSTPLTPIVSADSVVGYLGVRRNPALGSQLDRAFLEGQRQALWLIVAIAVLVCAVASWLVARHLSRPVGQLIDATRALRAGHFETRIERDRSDELGQLADDFNALALTLERNESLRRRWVADTSHELRTPVSVLRAEVEALQDGVREVDERSLASLHAEVLRLSKLIEDLYELSRADVGALSYSMTVIDLNSVIDDSCHVYRERAQDRGLVLTADLEPARVRADADRLRQLFSNLIENALRYTDSPGRVRISLRAQDAHVIVDVDDSAPGVPRDALPRLFERFYRVDAARTRERGGSGLGLAIGRSIVEAHGGEIEADVSPLGGLRVSFRLPLAESAA